MAQKNAAAVAKKWSSNLSGSTTSIRQGVDAVSVSPTQKAAARVDAYQQGVQRAVSEGRFVAGCNRVDLASWKNDMITKGIPRIGAGAMAAEPKMQAFMTKFLPYVAQGQAMLEATPRGDRSQNIQRMITMVNFLGDFKYS